MKWNYVIELQNKSNFFLHILNFNGLRLMVKITVSVQLQKTMNDTKLMNKGLI